MVYMLIGTTEASSKCTMIDAAAVYVAKTFSSISCHPQQLTSDF